MSPIDAWTDGIVKVLERREWLQGISDGIEILKELRRDMTVADISGHEFLCSVQIYMEKKAVEICREAESSGSDGTHAEGGQDSLSGGSQRSNGDGSRASIPSATWPVGNQSDSLPDSLTPSVEKGTLL